MNFQPLGTQIVIEEEPKADIGGIALPDTMESLDYNFFRVVAVGTGMITASGQNVPLPLKENDRVHLLPSAVGNLIKLPTHLCDGKTRGVIEIRHVAGVWQGELPAPKVKTKILVGAN